MTVRVAVGERLASAVCETEVIVIRAPAGEINIECGGSPMVAAGSPEAHGGDLRDAPADGGTVVGKRYVDTGQTLELLCTKSGRGGLRAGGYPMSVRPPKNLPSSD